MNFILLYVYVGKEVWMCMCRLMLDGTRLKRQRREQWLNEPKMFIFHKTILQKMSLLFFIQAKSFYPRRYAMRAITRQPHILNQRSSVTSNNFHRTCTYFCWLYRIRFIWVPMKHLKIEWANKLLKVLWRYEKLIETKYWNIFCSSLHSFSADIFMNIWTPVNGLKSKVCV